MGPAAPAGSGITLRGSNSAGNVQVDGGDRGRWQQKSAPIDADPDRTITDDLEPNLEMKIDPITKVTDAATTMPRMKSVNVGPSSVREPLIRVIPFLLKKGIQSYSFLHSIYHLQIY